MTQPCCTKMAISQLLRVASSNLVGRNSKWYFIIKFSLLLSIIFCWREIRPDAGKTTENKFVASFLSIDCPEKRIQATLVLLMNRNVCLVAVHLTHALFLRFS